MTALQACALLHQPLLESAKRWPRKCALVCGARRLGDSELVSQVALVAQALHARKVRSGDRVALFLDNSIEMVSGLYAVLSLGAVAVPVNPLTKPGKLAHLLDDSGATAMLTQASLATAWREALAHAPLVQTCWVSSASAVSGDPRVLPWPRAGVPDAACAAAAAGTAQHLAALEAPGSAGAPA